MKPLIKRMTRNKVARILILGTIFIVVIGCAGMDTSEHRTFIQNIIGRNPELSGESSRKLWEGEIEGQRVSYFRSRGQKNFASIIVVTQDHLPDNYRSIEYHDNNGDRNLDLINVKRYSSGDGWDDVTIADGDTHALKHANTQYNELLNKIIDLRMQEIEF